MRILVVHNAYRSAAPTGEDMVARDEAGLMRSSGHEVAECRLSNDALEGMSRVMRAARAGIGAVWSPLGARVVEEEVRRFGPDVVHFHNLFPQLSSASLWRARALGAAVVHTVHNYRIFCANGLFFRDGSVCEACPREGRHMALRHGCYRGSRLMTSPIVAGQFLDALLRTWQRAVDRFIALTDFAREKLVEFGLPGERLVVKPNYAPAVSSEPGATPSGFLFAGRLMDYKGVRVILEAARQASELTFAFAGDGPLASEVSSSGLANVAYLGRLTPGETHRQMARYAALLLPSLCYEGFPRTAAEAMSAGVPIIGSGHGALSAIVEDGRTGLLCDPGDPAQLVERCRRIAADTGLRDRLGENGRLFWKSRLSAGAMSEMMTEVYEEAIRARGDHASAALP